MSAAKMHKLVSGFKLCVDPAREDCFNVAQSDAEMTEMTDFAGDTIIAKAGRRERLHRHMNNEVGAMEIAAQCLVDFPDAPWDLQMQLARQTFDEGRHVEGLYNRLRAVGGYKGEFPIFNFEWCVTNTQDTLAARLAIQNRTFEAGQMDLLGTLRKIWRNAGDFETAELLEAILADEVNHVRFANRWIRKLAGEDGRVLLKVALAIRFLAEANAAGQSGVAPDPQANHARMGINIEDRQHAEFSDEEIAEVLRQSGMSSFLINSRAVAPNAQ